MGRRRGAVAIDRQLVDLALARADVALQAGNDCSTTRHGKSSTDGTQLGLQSFQPAAVLGELVAKRVLGCDRPLRYGDSVLEPGELHAAVRPRSLSDVGSGLEQGDQIFCALSWAEASRTSCDLHFPITSSALDCEP